MGQWNYPAEYRLVGEHFAARIGQRVRCSPYLKVAAARTRRERLRRLLRPAAGADPQKASAEPLSGRGVGGSAGRGGSGGTTSRGWRGGTTRATAWAPWSPSPRTAPPSRCPPGPGPAAPLAAAPLPPGGGEGGIQRAALAFCARPRARAGRGGRGGD